LPQSRVPQSCLESIPGKLHPPPCNGGKAATTSIHHTDAPTHNRSQQSFLEVASRKASDKLYFQALPPTSLSTYQHQLSRQKVVAALLTLRLPEREAGNETLF
jgi:hypothetical protein